LLRDYETEVIRAIEIMNFVSRFRFLLETWSGKDEEPELFDRMLSDLTGYAEEFYRDYSPDIDMKVTGNLLAMYHQDIPAGFQPEMLRQAAGKYRGNFEDYAAWLFSRSIYPSREKIMDQLVNFNYKSPERFNNDPVYQLALEFEKIFSSIDPAWAKMNQVKAVYNRTYMESLRAWKKDQILYPDANRTLRISYGTVEGYRPRDALRYGYMTTLDGILEKYNRDIPEYEIPPGLKELYDDRDYGKYAAGDTMPVCFIANNHTTNGNSGSPVLNGRGQLIGVNFDRNWEGTVSDFTYIESQCRNISIDIRYALFIIDRFAGAGYLLDEMDLVE
jgi:hypothetical protein